MDDALLSAAEPDKKLTAAELVAYLADCDKGQRDDEAWAWLQAQPDPAEAARQVLTAAASTEPRLRLIAANVVELLGEDALPVWREMTAVPGIGPHAKFSLYTMEADPGPNDGEWLWLVTEFVAAALAEKGPDDAVTLLCESLPAEPLAAGPLAAEDLEHRLAVVRATDHPSALPLVAAIEDFVASTGAESLSVNQCLQLKVSLARWQPPISRTVLVPAGVTLATLHRVIQVLYGWDGDHLHAFQVCGDTYSDPSFPLEHTQDEYAMRTLAALNAGGGKITYEYDFGASWIHEIALQKRLPRDPSVSYPVCVKYSGDSPAEYDEQEVEPFDLEAVNRRLQDPGAPSHAADDDGDLTTDPIILDMRQSRVHDGADPTILDLGQAMLDDGVDPNDQEAITEWLAAYYTIAGYHGPEHTDWYDVNLAAALHLPPVLSPLRLPDETALATQARQSKLLADLRSLANEVRKTTVQTAATSSFLITLAEEIELVEQHDDTLVPGEDIAYLDDLADGERALKAWDYMFAKILDTTLLTADESDPVVDSDLDWSCVGPVVAMKLFLDGRNGRPVAELAEDCRTTAVIELEEENEAERQWQEWVDAHGDPTELLLSQLERHGAVSVADGVVRLEPLGLYAVRSKLVEDGVRISLLPPPDEMTPDNLMQVRLDCTEQDFGTELAAWVATRGAEQAARELLDFAADAPAITRTTLITVVDQLGQDAEPAWREALDRTQLRCYAKSELARLAGFGPDAPDLPTELRSTQEDRAWLLADSFGSAGQLNFGDGKSVRELERPAEVFEIMARLDHPDAEIALTMIGKHADDKKIAKAARRAAYKASTRRASRAPSK